MFLDKNGQFKSNQENVLYRLIEKIDSLQIKTGKFYSFSQCEKIEDMKFAFCSVYTEDSHLFNVSLFHEAEIFKLIDTMLELVQYKQIQFLCFKSSSVLFDMLMNKLKLNIQE